MQIIGDPFAFILPDGDLGKDLFPLQPHITPVITDDAHKEINDNYGDNYRKENGDIQDLVFHYTGLLTNTGLFELEL